jgi:hypothetical protein
MRIILICSSLEPGRDGVGDYARRLAVALINKNNQVALLALNDKHINQVTAEEQEAEGLKIAALRIPTQTFPNHISQIKNWIANFNPDWLSLQYVIFGYHPKGLPFGLGKQLLAIGNGRAWHIMFHELWLGMANEESVKLKLWGTVQRYLIKSLLNSLRPRVIHTQTKLYQQQLAKMGCQAGYLPIFSNIPVVNDAVKQDDSNIRLVVFGLIHTGAAIEPLAMEAALYANKHQAKIMLTFIGRCGQEQGKWAAAWQQQGLPVEELGEQPADRISIILQNATLGLSSTAMAVVEKSGAFAAMRSHRLPVLNISKPWTPRGIAAPPQPAGIVAYISGSLEKVLADGKEYITGADDVDTIAQKMLNDLFANK